MDAHPDAHRDAAGRSSEVVRRADAGEDLAGDDFQIAQFVDVGNDDREFIAAEARDRVGGARDRLQAAGDLSEQFVAGIVAIRVVDRLEAIEVEEHHPDLAAGSLAMRQRQFQLVAETDPVGESSERVVQQLEAQTLLDQQALAHVLSDDHDPTPVPGHIGAIGPVEIELPHLTLSGQQGNACRGGRQCARVRGHQGAQKFVA